MLIQKAYKYRLYPTDQQAQRLRQLCGCARFVWNYALNETLSIHDAGGKIPSAFDLNKRLTGWKNSLSWPFFLRVTLTTSSRN
ncbi:helix-turn-helix domain-containing protein [Escherichia coli]|nr:helix-turn-helix domain-containing protein [Escherichia coli]